MKQLKNESSYSLPWLKNAWFDSVFILGPPFFSVFIVLFFLTLGKINSVTPVTSIWWVVLILGVDVVHVYGTLFRTYFHSLAWRKNKNLFTMVPLVVWLIGAILYSIGGPSSFWRGLTYLAIFHFIRQQYGLLRLYSGLDAFTKFERSLDAFLIYISTLYPLTYWHSHPDRNFHWFIEGDFFNAVSPVFSTLIGMLYVLTIGVYLLKEGYFLFLINRPLNVLKNAVIFGTGISWYVGIVLLNGDLLFTAINVLSHGIPYLALIWIYGEKDLRMHSSLEVISQIPYSCFFKKFSFPLFFGVLFIFAYFEEGLWDGLVWRERQGIFGEFWGLPRVSYSDTLSWLVPLLMLPQGVHYVLDGFIWKLNKKVLD